MSGMRHNSWNPTPTEKEYYRGLLIKAERDAFRKQLINRACKMIQERFVDIDNGNITSIHISFDKNEVTMQMRGQGMLKEAI